jgi:formate hydrogenlyase transcriptional activator
MGYNACYLQADAAPRALFIYLQTVPLTVIVFASRRQDMERIKDSGLSEPIRLGNATLDKHRPMDDRSDDIRRLQGCINDLISLLALPALWRGRGPPQVVDTLLDALLSMLRLDIVYARLNPAAGDSRVEVVRIAQPPKTIPKPEDVGRALEPWLNHSAVISNCVAPNPLGEGEVSLACSWLGLDCHAGVIVVGSQRADFPNKIESLLLRVAVNQAVIELQTAQVRAERQRAEESERRRRQLHAQNMYLRQELDTEQQWGDIVGQSKALKAVLKLVEQVAPTNACALIQGETGTGKELIARAIHRMSDRKDKAFVKFNCAAIPTGLLESELFGHEKGAFTGAIAQRVGRFELADRGTIFLDEVGEVPLELQSKLLRVLQEQEFERLGSSKTIRVDVRLVAASNRDLAQMVADRTFRSDLYYRLKVFPILMPPLRDRAEDIPDLVRCFTERYVRQFRKPIKSIDADAMLALCKYSWPGNIREVENFVERCVILSQGTTLEVPLGELLPVVSTVDATTLQGFEREHILRCLSECHWVIAGPEGAAAKLGMKRTTLQSKMQKLGIARPE